MRPGRWLAAVLFVAALIGAAATRPFDEQPVPPPPAPALLAAESRAVASSDERQLELLAAEDERLRTLVTGLRTGSAPYVQEVDGVETLVLTPRGLDYGLQDLVARGAAEEQAGGAVLLDRHVLVAPGAQLTLQVAGGDLRLRSDAGRFTSLVGWKGDVTVRGTADEPLQVRSWDAAAGGPDDRVTDGRAYLRVVGAEMDLEHVRARGLGFWAGRTGGVAWTGGSGAPATGSITHSSFTEGHYGVFAAGTEGLRVTGAGFTDNAVDGLSLHRDSVDTVVVDSVAGANGRHGISADRGAAEIALTGVDAVDNAQYGIIFDGSPLSEGPSAGGASPHGYGTLTVVGGRLAGNGKAGLQAIDADDVTVVGTTLVANRDGVVLVGTTSPTTVVGTTITGPHRFGVTATGGTADVRENRVVGAETAIRVREATVAVRDNTIERATAHGISVTGASVDSSVVGNSLSGRGPSGLDLHRLAPGVSVEPAGNDVEDWVRDRDNGDYWAAFLPNHPMLVLWILVLGVPLAAAFRGRRVPRAVGTPPYRDELRRGAIAPVRFQLDRALPPGGAA